MDSMDNPALRQRALELGAEYDEALDRVLAGKAIPIDDNLRYLLARVAAEIQGAIDENLLLRLDDLALLCLTEAKAAWQGDQAWDEQALNNTIHTLYIRSKSLLRISSAQAREA